ITGAGGRARARMQQSGTRARRPCHGARARLCHWLRLRFPPWHGFSTRVCDSTDGLETRATMPLASICVFAFFVAPRWGALQVVAWPFETIAADRAFSCKIVHAG